MEIRHMNNLRISLILAWFLPYFIFSTILGFLFKEILFFTLENMLRDIAPSVFVIITATTIILFIYNEVALKPLIVRYRSRIHEYRPKYEAIDALYRGILLCIVIDLIFFSQVYLWYPSEVSGLGWRIFIEFKTAFLSLVICESVMLLGLIFFSYLWRRGADHIEKDKFENWLETDFPSFPIKSGIIFFILSLTGASFWAVYIIFFVNPDFLSPMLIISISQISFSLALSLLYYLLIKRIIGRFLERHELI